MNYDCIFSYVPLFFLVYQLYNSMFLPLTVLQKILLGALKWYGPREGLVFILLRRKARYFTGQHKKSFLELVEYFTVISIYVMQMSQMVVHVRLSHCH